MLYNRLRKTVCILTVTITDLDSTMYERKVREKRKQATILRELLNESTYTNNNNNNIINTYQHNGTQ